MLQPLSLLLVEAIVFFGPDRQGLHHQGFAVRIKSVGHHSLVRQEVIFRLPSPPVYWHWAAGEVVPSSSHESPGGMGLAPSPGLQPWGNATDRRCYERWADFL